VAGLTDALVAQETDLAELMIKAITFQLADESLRAGISQILAGND
jgi:hypothetical protein